MKEHNFKNTIEFSEAAQVFIKTGKYTDYSKGTPAFKSFWDEEHRRCEEGYTVGNTTITGRHYFYLNYCPIKKVQFDSKGKATKTVSYTTFPDFYDGDYDFFWLKDIARNGITEAELKKLNLIVEPLDLEGDKNLILAKARRK